MRKGLIAVGIAVCIGLHHVWITHVAEAALGDDARLAIELRCEVRQGYEGRKCRKLLEKLFLAGRLDPERTLRAYCTPLEIVELGTRPPAPPPLCIERYGGWRKG